MSFDVHYKNGNEKDGERDSGDGRQGYTPFGENDTTRRSPTSFGENDTTRRSPTSFGENDTKTVPDVDGREIEAGTNTASGVPEDRFTDSQTEIPDSSEVSR